MSSSDFSRLVGTDVRRKNKLGEVVGVYVVSGHPVLTVWVWDEQAHKKVLRNWSYEEVTPA